MIRRDSMQIIVDSTCDGGDSANRMGLYALCRPTEWTYLTAHFIRDLPVRHPTQEPWNNSKNFSRDQLIAYTAGLAASGSPVLKQIAAALFKTHVRRFGICLNTERDWPGSTKYPWPHRVDGKLRLFDMPDILSPADMWHLARAASSPWQYILAVVGAPFLVLELLVHTKLVAADEEDNQTIAKCAIAGPLFLRLFRLLKPGYRNNAKLYWGTKRDMAEMADLLIELVESA